MIIDREKLEKIVTKILQELEMEKTVSQKKYNVVFSYPWVNHYYVALDELREESENLRLYIPKCFNEKIDEISNILTKSEIITYDPHGFCTQGDIIVDSDSTVFLRLTRNNVIDMIELYERDFISHFIKRLFSNGQNVFYWKLEKLTGKEPTKYKEKVLKYHKEMLEFGVLPIELKVVKK